MKDLYKRLGLPIDAPEHQILTAIMTLKSEAEKENLIYILFDENRRGVYNRALLQVRRIGQLRADLNLTETPHWNSHIFQDFVYPAKTNFQYPGSKPLSTIGKNFNGSFSGKFRPGWGKIVWLLGGLFLLWVLYSTFSSIPPKKVPYDEQPLPYNGTLYSDYGNRIAPLKIITSEGSPNYYVKVVSTQYWNEVLNVFIRSGQSVEVEVPLGSYEIRYAAGEKWYGQHHLFGPKTQYGKADRIFEFKEVGGYVHGYTVELIWQSDGNLRTLSINPSEF